MLLKLDATGAGRLFAKNVSSVDAPTVAEKTAVEDTASKTNKAIIDKRVLVFFVVGEILFALVELKAFILFLLSFLNIFIYLAVGE
jgi:hypothetical protein